MAATAPPGDADVAIKVEDKPTLTPPASEGTDKNYDSGSDLSDLEPEGDCALDDRLFDDVEIEPDHYYEGGKIPVFKPVGSPGNGGSELYWGWQCLKFFLWVASDG